MEELYYCLIVRKQVERVFGGPEYGTKYSLDGACDVCGTGAEPIGPRIVTSFKAPKSPIFSILGEEMLVNLETAQELHMIGVECLAEVRGLKTKTLLPLMELRWEAVLPPFAEETRGYERDRPCPKCNRDGFFGIPREPYRLVYKNLSAEYRHKKVLATFERFGNSRLRSPFKDSHFATPLPIVSGQVGEYLQTKAGKVVDLEPVAISWG